MTTELRWWQKAVFYQIYPRSFADGDGDGIGDLPGIIGKLDYLRDLGVDAIWLSPHYPSPLYDCGYDVADYTGVAPEYGTLDDFKRFLDGAHARGLRVVLDLVLNHTSDQHPWFLESRSSRDNPKRDWYIWRTGKGDAPPNNWLSTFGGSAWEFDPATGQYYYHFFFKQQPDLNWRNPEVKQAMFDAMRFWFNLGVDGFRIDAIGTVYEDPALADHTLTLPQAEVHRRGLLARTAEEQAEMSRLWRELFRHQHDYPGVHDLMRELRAVADEYDDRVLIGETDDIGYYGNGRDELHLVFNFPLMRAARLTPAWVRANQQERLSALPPAAWPGNTLGNHDTSRVLSRYGDGQNDEALARLSLALMLTLRGTPFLYNGEEIGMADLLLTDIRQFRDMYGVWLYQMDMEVLGTPPAEAVARAARGSRDKCRTPMQWANTAHGGFCPEAAQPWLPVNANHARGINVAGQLADPDSLLNFYRRLLRLRKESPALIGGDYAPLPESGQALAFLRRAPGQTCLVALNMAGEEQLLKVSDLNPSPRLLFSSNGRAGGSADLSRLSLGPFEIFIAEVTSRS